MNTLLKVSLLLCLSISSTTYASSVSDEDIKEGTPPTHARVLETETPRIDTIVKSMRRLLKTETPPADEKSKKLANALTNSHTQHVLVDPDLLMGIFSLLHYEDKPSTGLGPIVKDGERFEDLKNFRLVAMVWHSTLNNKNGLTSFFPFFKDIINAEDDGISPFRVVISNIASFKPLDFVTYLWTNLLISGNGEIVLYNEAERHWKYNVKTGQRSYLEQCRNAIGITEDGKTVLGRAWLTPEDNPIPALWEDGQETPSSLLPLHFAYDISQDKTILGLEAEGQTYNLVLYKDGEIIERFSSSFAPSRLLPDGKTILGHSDRGLQQTAIYHKGKITNMPQEFRWTSARSKGQQMIGVYNDHLAEYKDGKFEELTIDPYKVKVINDGLIVYNHPTPDLANPSAHIWKDGFYYSAFQLLKKIGCALEEIDNIEIMDVSRDNRTFVGRIVQPNKNTTFIARMPSSLFDEQTRVKDNDN
ncbi:MAG: hypothetical protein ACTHJ4_00560 [Candidatus Nucleicultricaceae bacterium]